MPWIKPIAQQVHPPTVHRRAELDAGHEPQAVGRCRLTGRRKARYSVVVRHGERLKALLGRPRYECLRREMPIGALGVGVEVGVDWCVGHRGWAGLLHALKGAVRGAAPEKADNSSAPIEPNLSGRVRKTDGISSCFSPTCRG